VKRHQENMAGAMIILARMTPVAERQDSTESVPVRGFRRSQVFDALPWV
jgi:hypothetical protein